MFRLLRKLFQRLPEGEMFFQSEKNIYSYWDGSRIVYTDPIDLYKRIMTIGPELDVDIKVARSPSKKAMQAHDDMVKKIRELFSIKPFEQNGLTEVESKQLLDSFLIYCDVIRKQFQINVDAVDGNIFFYSQMIRRNPTYLEYFGFWLNRDRVMYRRTRPVALGAAIALGMVDPGLEYYRAITDGEGEALMMKGRQDAARRMNSGE